VGLAGDGQASRRRHIARGACAHACMLERGMSEGECDREGEGYLGAPIHHLGRCGTAAAH
jgi:hypothetical protein